MRHFTKHLSFLNRAPIRLALAVVATGVIGIGVVWGIRYIQNYPDRVLGQALTQLAQAQDTTFQGEYRVMDTKSTAPPTEKLAFTFQGQADQTRSATVGTLQIGGLTLPGKLHSDQNATYLMLDNPTALADQAIAQPVFAPFAAQLKASATKLQGKWLKIDTKSGDAPDQTACSRLFAGTALNSDTRRQLDSLLRSRRFLAVDQKMPNETIDGHDNFHYKLHFDQSSARVLIDELLKLEPFKNSLACLKPATTKEGGEVLQKLQAADIDFWADAHTHSPTKLRVKFTDAETSATLTLALQLNKGAHIVMPTDGIVEFKDLLETIKLGR